MIICRLGLILLFAFLSGAGLAGQDVTPEPLIFAGLYPDELGQKGLEGTVLVDFVVMTNGRIAGAYASAYTDKGLAQAAINAVSGSRISPGTHDGRPINMMMSQGVIYRIEAPSGIEKKPYAELLDLYENLREAWYASITPKAPWDKLMPNPAHLIWFKLTAEHGALVMIPDKLSTPDDRTDAAAILAALKWPMKNSGTSPQLMGYLETHNYFMVEFLRPSVVRAIVARAVERANSIR